MKDDSDSDWVNRRRVEEETEESKLARAKLILMLRNLGGRATEDIGTVKHPQGSRGFLRDDAHHWFFEPSDFEWWCEAAGFDPVYVRRRAKVIYEEGLPEVFLRRHSSHRGGKSPTAARPKTKKAARGRLPRLGKFAG